MSDSLFAVQDALYDSLLASSALQAVLGNPPRLYDHVPSAPTYPYISFGNVSAVPFDTKDRTGFRQVMRFHIWSRYRGRKESKDIGKVLYGVLHRAVMTVTGEAFVDCRLLSISVEREADNLTTHTTVDYEILTLTP
jgi:Protein of unknown function (DUF3168)